MESWSLENFRQALQFRINDLSCQRWSQVQMDYFIREGERRVSRDTLALEMSCTIPTTAGQQLYTMSAYGLDMVDILAAEIAIASNQYLPLTKIDVSTLNS